jgi:ribosomal protein S18 acetylase RimI-like enzyme
MKRDISGNPFYIARDKSGKVLGFASVKKNTEQAAELEWLAVAADCRRQGVGTVIVETVCSALKAKGLKLLLARTLSKSSNYAPYEASRLYSVDPGTYSEHELFLPRLLVARITIFADTLGLAFKIARRKIYELSVVDKIIFL